MQKEGCTGNFLTNGWVQPGAAGQDGQPVHMLEGNRKEERYGTDQASARQSVGSQESGHRHADGGVCLSGDKRACLYGAVFNGIYRSDRVLLWNTGGKVQPRRYAELTVGRYVKKLPAHLGWQFLCAV